MESCLDQVALAAEPLSASFPLASSEPSVTTDADRRACARAAVERLIVAIDRMLSRQLDEILHHPRFQRLEASWRGLRYLTEVEAEYDEDLNVKIKVLNVSWAELVKDLTRALEFDQSHLFQRIYSDEFDMPGGEPLGVLLCDYEVSHRPRPNQPAGDIDALTELARIGAAALCPVIVNASSELFGLDSFAELARLSDPHAIFQQREYARWRQLRRDEHARFLGLTMPRILMREPYRDDGSRRQRFVYEERIDQSPAHYLWGGANYAFGSVLIRAFANTGWFADIRGGVHEFGEGGVVRHLVYPRFADDRRRVAPRCATEVQISDHTERELSELGFIPLCSYHGVEHSVFYSNASLHEPLGYESEIANANARLSAMTQYMLCVSRFGHYIKLIGRDKIGSFTNAGDCQRILQNWLNHYTTASDGASAELKARYPLAASSVELEEQPRRPGYFTCTIHLQPHFQLDQLTSSIRLVTELAVGTVGVGG